MTDKLLGIFEKTIDFLSEKNWVMLIVSIIAPYFILRQMDDSYYEKFPSQDIIVNFIILYVVIALIIFLALYAILAIIKKFRNGKRNRQDKKYNSIVSKKEEEQAIEAFLDYHDNITDKDYSIVMYLLDHENKIPYIEVSGHYKNRYTTNNFLSDLSKFSSSEYYRVVETIETPDGIETNAIHGTQYLLKEKYYKDLLYVKGKVGKICHFERTLVDLKQNEV